MTPSLPKIVVPVSLILLGIVIGVGIVFAIERKEHFDRMIDARDAAPNTEKFDQDFAAMSEWLENYKRDNPGATDEETKKAFEEIWKK